MDAKLIKQEAVQVLLAAGVSIGMFLLFLVNI